MCVNFLCAKLDDSNTARQGNKLDGLLLCRRLRGFAQLICSSWREIAVASKVEVHGIAMQCGKGSQSETGRCALTRVHAAMRATLRSEAVKRC